MDCFESCLTCRYRAFTVQKTHHTTTMAITAQILKSACFKARYVGAATVTAAADLPTEKKAARLQQFAKHTEKAIEKTASRRKALSDAIIADLNKSKA